MSEIPARILVADDDRPIRALVGEFLTSQGYAVDLVADGLEAVRKATEEEYDLIVMDIAMPRFNGVEAIRTIRRQKPEQKILVVTAFLAGEVAEEIASAGASRALAKPVGIDELSAAVAEALG